MIWIERVFANLAVFICEVLYTDSKNVERIRARDETARADPGIEARANDLSVPLIQYSTIRSGGTARASARQDSSRRCSGTLDENRNAAR